MEEHRKDTRVPLRLEVEWAGWRNRCPDVTSDVSLGGCYVESLNPVKVGEVLKLGITLSSNRTLQFLGEVRYHQPTVGFGIKFLQLSSFEQATLAALIKREAKRTCVDEFVGV